MTEHDAPTVARATLWLDTSNETTTRPAERFEDRATIAFERPRLEPSTTTAASSGPALPSAVTAVLDHASVFAAFEARATDTFAAAAWPGDAAKAIGWRGRWQLVASHAVAMAVGAAAVACALVIGQSAAASRAQHGRERQAEHAVPRAGAVSTERPGKALPPRPASATDDAALDATAAGATMHAAVEALARGDYAAASAMYGELAKQRPHDAALAAVADILTDRIAARCDARAQSPCAR